MNFQEVSAHITRLIGPPVACGRWRLPVGAVYADCSATAIIVRIACYGADASLLEVRTPADLDEVSQVLTAAIAQAHLGPRSTGRIA